MVDELRMLTFNASEVEEALVAFAEATDRGLPKGRVKQVNLTRDKEVRATLQFEPDDEKATFNEYEMAVAMLRFCAKQNIPVPKRGQKAVSIADGAVRLSIALKS